MSGCVRLSFIEADADYEVRAVDSIFPDEVSVGVAESELSMVMTSGEALATVDRWLSESRVAREAVAFVVPPSCPLAAGDVVRIEAGKVSGTFRIDRIEDGGVKQVEAVRVERGIYEGPAVEDELPVTRPVSVPLPVWPVVLDLPLVPANDVPEAPWVAAGGEPWPGDVAVYSSADGNAWQLDTTFARRAVIGQTLNDLVHALPGLWDRGAPLDVRLASGSLSSIDDAALLAGGNMAVLLAPGVGRGEVFQFRDAVLSGPDTWSVSLRLRGQQGTDKDIPAVWPAGSTFLVLDGALQQVSASGRLMEGDRRYRIGPASKPVDHGSFVEISHQASGLALKPYAPAHLRARREADGSLLVSWVRRSRIDGDNWALAEVPLGEVFETYRVQVFSGGLRREATVGAPEWSYGLTEQASDGLGGSFAIEVAQISDRVGPGHIARIEIDG